MTKRVIVIDDEVVWLNLKIAASNCGGRFVQTGGNEDVIAYEFRRPEELR